MYGQNLDAYLRLTFDAIRASAPQLVFWPESSMTFFLPDEPAYQSAIGRVLEASGAELVAGGPRIVKSPDGAEPTYFNSTFLVSPQGRVLAWQDKTKLLPFAEYFPLQSIDLLRRSFGRARQFSPGAPQPPLPSVAGRAGVVVCNEAMFPEIASQSVASGAELLVNPANDSWFGSLKYSLQALDIVRLRAIEQRRFVVRTSTAGPSAIIDPTGRIVAQSGTFTREWLSGSVRPERTITPYARVGDAFAWASGLAALGACVHAARRST
jgi:apolipoprotein N-acyltransferase